MESLTNHKKSYQHVGVDIYPVLKSGSASFYKRKSKKYDQNATTHLLPGTHIELKETTGQLIPMKEQQKMSSGVTSRLFRTTADLEKVSNPKTIKMQEYHMQWADNTKQHNMNLG